MARISSRCPLALSVCLWWDWAGGWGVTEVITCMKFIKVNTRELGGLIIEVIMLYRHEVLLIKRNA